MRTNRLSRAARVLSRGASVLAVVLGAASCASNGFGDESGAGDDRTWGADPGPPAATRSEQGAGATVQGVATFTAADVARIVLVLEQTQVAQARLAVERATTIEVKTYAARIVRERTEAMERLASILNRTTPRSDDPTPPLLEGELGRSRDWVAAQESAFELPFMTAEIGAHARILGLLEASLLPSASRAAARDGADATALELEQELLDLRAQTSAQIVHALRVQGVLRAGNAPIDESTTASGGGSIGDGADRGAGLPR